MKIEVYGWSDDIVYVKIGEETMEFYAEDIDFLTFYSANDSGGCKIYPIYDRNGCWSFAVGLRDEGLLIPKEWKISIKNGSSYGGSNIPYTTVLEIDNVNDYVMLV